MTITISTAKLRAAGLVFVGALLGATLVAPVSAQVTGSAVEPAATQTRSASCAGLSFYPADWSGLYDSDGPLRFHGGQTGESVIANIYRCAVALPHRAVVTRVQFTLRDTAESESYDVTGCRLIRSGLTPATATSFDFMALVPSTSSVTAAPGIVRFTDSSIRFATVDNTRFGYWLECRISSSGLPELGIYGANVVYTISSTNG